MPTKFQLIQSARVRAAKIRAVANHFANRIVEPLPMPHTQEELCEYLRDSSLTAAALEYLRAKKAELEN